MDLLARYVVAENLFNEPEPLAITFLKSQSKELEPSQKVKLLKKLGDTSLYISGFFGESLNRKVVDLEYYREMGSIAYLNLSDIIKDQTFQNLYNQLYLKFAQLVDVLADISTETLGHSQQNLLQLYEKYITTGSEQARRQLSDKGLPMPAFSQETLKKRKAT